MDVPWKLDYHDTRFCFSLSQTASVVIVLAQLDDRYFRGLEGQYRFVLSFRLHKAGHEDYLVRSEIPYRMRRGVNVEMELESGEYEVRVRLDTTRFEYILPVDQVLRQNVKSRRDKMIRVGLAYDLAHSKGVIEETAEEKAAKERKEKKKKEKQRQELRERLLRNREETHYLRMKQFLRQQGREQRQKEKERKKRAERKAKQDERRKKAVNGVSPPHAVGGDLQAGEQQDGTLEGKARSIKTQVDDGEGEQLSAEEDQPTDEKEIGAPEKQTPERSAAKVEDHDQQGDDTPLKERNTLEIVVSNADEPSEHPATVQDHHSDSFCESEESDSDPESYHALSDLSDREVNLQIDALMPAQQTAPAPPPTTNEEPDEFELSPWNAVAVIGLRVYHKVDESHPEPATVKLRVVRSNPYLDSDEEEAQEDKKDEEKTGGLDVDDAAKDATLEGEAVERRRSIVGDGENGLG